MTYHTLNASAPQHLYGLVCREILYRLDPKMAGQYESCVIFGVTSIPGRALHFSVMCESGAQFARVPLHMIRWIAPGRDARPLGELQCWDSYGWSFSVTQYEYLREMVCDYRTPDGEIVPAHYWFTLDHTDNSYSQAPEQHKCYHLLLLDDGSGQIAAQPNNRILWRDKSFIRAGQHPLDYRVMHPTTWHAERGRSDPQATAYTRDDPPVIRDGA